MRSLILRAVLIGLAPGLVAAAVVSARAEPLRAHGVLAVGHALAGHQADEYDYGGLARASLEYPIGNSFGVELSLSGLSLLEGDPPADPRIETERGATAIAAALGPRLRPFATGYRGSAFSPAGLWLGGSLGATFSGGLARPLVDAALGYDFMDVKGKRGLGPVVSFLHVFQPDGELRPGDANLLFVGLHGFVDFGRGLHPDSDRDGDGILDDFDRCPDAAEDKDGFQDKDGCPELDNDGDGVLDAKDRCPLSPEDLDRFQDDDGCPETDNDRDGLLDRVDQCPNEAEDDDGWDSLDGCPDPDNDADGILDTNDLCPFEAETVNGYADNDGCPDEEQVRVVGDKIVLDDRVHFFVNSAVIRQVSYPLLQRLAKLVGEHPEYTHISIEGHADERGAEDFNRKLSEERASSVLEFMVKQGVLRPRLTATGFGASRPLVESKSEYAWLLNRRVEFTVTRELRQAPTAPVPSSSSKAPSPSVTTPPTSNSRSASPSPDDQERETKIPPPEAGHPERAPGVKTKREGQSR